MNTSLSDLPDLCRAKPHVLDTWFDTAKEKTYFCIALIIIGGGFYGAAMGYWRDPLQAFYIAVKFPLLLLLVALGNAVLNGMLAQVLGLNLSFRHSFLAILMSFALLSVIVGALTPLCFFLIYNLPSLHDPTPQLTYSALVYTHVIIIAFAGTMANIRLINLLQHLCGERQQARYIFSTWLAVNLLLGSQLSWNLRPFFGTPYSPVAFFRDNPFQGSFYESLFNMALRFLSN